MYSLTLEKMKRESGERAYPIWLLVNPKHPAVCHNIWTPVLAQIQDKVYRELHARIDTSNIYIRNTVEDCGVVPNTLNWWGAEVASEIESFRQMVLKYRPKILVSFGAFPFEFVRRVYGIKPEKGPKSWSNYNLGAEFRRSIENFDINHTNTIPLLRRVFAGGKNSEDESSSCINDGESYFCYAGTKIAEKIIEYKDSLNIWID